MLYYYDHIGLTGTSNLGDDLNPWLLGEVLGVDTINNPKHTVVGVGTLLNDYTEGRVDSNVRKSVYSSGYGYGSRVPRFDETWKFYAVRGYLSRNELGLSDTVTVGDGAVLVPRYASDLSLKAGQRSNEVIFIPHIETDVTRGKAWRRACEDAGVAYVSPAEPRDHLLAILANARLVMTSAMHGAIIADAMGTPWASVCSSDINVDKWHDWASALDLTVRFNQVLRLPFTNEASLRSRAERRTKRAIVARSLARLAKSEGQLSDRSRLRTVQDNLLIAADKLRAEAASL